MERGVSRSEELLDLFGLLLAGLTLGLLRAVAAFGEPLAEVVGMVGDVERLADELGDASGGPEIGAEPELGGGLGEPGADLGLLVRREEGFSSGRGRALQGVVAAGFVGADPESDGFGVNAEDLGDLFGRKSFGDALDGEVAPLRERRLGRGAWCHTPT